MGRIELKQPPAARDTLQRRPRLDTKGTVPNGRFNVVEIDAAALLAPEDPPT